MGYQESFITTNDFDSLVKWFKSPEGANWCNDHFLYPLCVGEAIIDIEYGPFRVKKGKKMIVIGGERQFQRGTGGGLETIKLIKDWTFIDDLFMYLGCSSISEVCTKLDEFNFEEYHE